MEHVFSYLKKLTVFAVVLTLAFSPIATGFMTPVAQALTCPVGEHEQTTTNGRLGQSSTSCVKDSTASGPADCALDKLGNCVAGFIYIFTVGLGSAVAYVGASFFNLAVHISLDAGAYSLDFVSAGWTTARDIANMAFIFILIYLALTIMFQANTSGTMHTLATVIIIALVINFSFFFTRLVIDAGNILAVQFYNAITASGKATPFSVGGSEQSGLAVQIPDLTAGIMQGVNLETALNSPSFKKFAADNNNVGGFVPYVIALSFLYISMGAMLFMLAGAFFMAGAKFLTRIVMLWFMIISAPLALVARASGMKQIEHYYHDWQGNLIRNAFYPVAFLFIFWILSRFMNDLGTGGAIEKLFQDLNSASSDSNFIAGMAIFIANLGIRIGFVIAMIYIALEASKKFGVYGAQAAEKFGNTMSLGGLAGYTRGLSRASGWAANQTVGRAAYSASQNLKASATSGSLWNSADRLARKTVFEPLSKTSFGGAKSFEDSVKDKKAREKENKADARDVQNHHDVDALAALQPELDRIKAFQANNRRLGIASGGTLSPDQQSTLSSGAALAASIKKFNKRELEHLKGDDIAKIVQHVTESQLKTLKDSDNFTDDQKRNFEDTWHTQSSDAPLEKMDKEILLLRKINTQLKASGITMARLDTHIGDLAAPTHGVTIGSTETEDMRKDIKKEMAGVRSAIKMAPPTQSTFDDEQKLDILQDAITRLEKFGEHAGKAPPGTSYKTK